MHLLNQCLNEKKERKKNGNIWHKGLFWLAGAFSLFLWPVHCDLLLSSKVLLSSQIPLSHSLSNQHLARPQDHSASFFRVLWCLQVKTNMPPYASLHTRKVKNTVMVGAEHALGRILQTSDPQLTTYLTLSKSLALAERQFLHVLVGEWSHIC